MTASESSRDNGSFLDSWNTVIALTLAYGSVSISADIANLSIGRPSECGLFIRSVGRTNGQVADWRVSIAGSPLGVHLVEYSDHYDLHVDAHDPHKTPVRHLVLDYYPAELVRKFTEKLLGGNKRNHR